MLKIFIAHSKDDAWLINRIAIWIRSMNIEPYLASLEDPTPLPLPQKILTEIKASAAMFVFLTPNVADNKNTRDTVNWEISQAYALKKPVYVFREKGVEVPLMISQITVYYTYDPFNEDFLKEMGVRLEKVASALKDEYKAKSDRTKLAALLLFILLLSGSDKE